MNEKTENWTLPKIEVFNERGAERAEEITPQSKPEETPFHELIYLEGGPKWDDACSGRGDWDLMAPLDRIYHYTNSSTRCEYARTNRTWASPIYGTTHTVFEFKRVMK